MVPSTLFSHQSQQKSVLQNTDGTRKESKDIKKCDIQGALAGTHIHCCLVKEETQIQEKKHHKLRCRGESSCC